MRILFIGDIVGAPGRRVLTEQLGSLRRTLRPDFVIVNGENAAHGKGITERIYRQFIRLGIDAITLGNHAFAKHEIMDHMDVLDKLLRPANMLPEVPGRSSMLLRKGDLQLVVMNMYGNVFMDHAAMDWESATLAQLAMYDAGIPVICDFHAEATAEKQLFAYRFCDQMSAILGTHTHVASADAQIIAGCGYMTDVGMTGPMHSVLGRDIDEVIRRQLRHEKTHYTVAQGPAMLHGVLLELNGAGRCIAIEPVVYREAD